ncbi:MAG: formylmethanofuran dehydrogenase [Chloroflexi bacterium]|nr:MAG: formylmethanofuran dehydrogenase [Chloroflexota bacterium]
MDFQILLEKSARNHSHLCPRQILGVRLGLAGMAALGFSEPPGAKRLLVITETDGCFVSGLSAATDCAVSHRTLRVEDYGKTAAVFVDTLTGQCVRVAPAPDIRLRAIDCAPDGSHRYLAQMQAYQSMRDDEMFTVTPVTLNTSIAAIVSRPGMRVNCGLCGEEIMNEREIKTDGITLCQACAHGAYYRAAKHENTLPRDIRQTATP